MSSITSWGPKAWGLLHTCSFSYPDHPEENDKRDMYNFLTSLSEVIPCKICKGHYKKYLEKNLPHHSCIALQGKEKLGRWVVDLHNDVNRRLNKPTWTYEQALEKYADTSSVCSVIRAEPLSAPPDDNTSSTYKIIVIMILLFLFISSISTATFKRLHKR